MLWLLLEQQAGPGKTAPPLIHVKSTKLCKKLIFAKSFLMSNQMICAKTYLCDVCKKNLTMSYKLNRVVKMLK